MSGCRGEDGERLAARDARVEPGPSTSAPTRPIDVGQAGGRLRAQHPAPAGGGAGQTEEAADRRGLPGSVGTEEPEHAPGTHGQLEPVECSDPPAPPPPVALVQRFDLDDRSQRDPPGRTWRTQPPDVEGVGSLTILTRATVGRTSIRRHRGSPCSIPEPHWGILPTMWTDGSGSGVTRRWSLGSSDPCLAGYGRQWRRDDRRAGRRGLRRPGRGPVGRCPGGLRGGRSRTRDGRRMLRVGGRPVVAGREPRLRRALHAGYALYRRGDDAAGAARCAVWLAITYKSNFGNFAAANGWIGRAERLLRGLEPGPLHGWLWIARAYRMADLRRRRGADRTGPRGRAGSRRRRPASWSPWPSSGTSGSVRATLRRLRADRRGDGGRAGR